MPDNALDMAQPAVPTYEIRPGLRVCRVLNGMWQVSGGHGRIDPAAAVREMVDYHDAGFTTWDLADHYGPAEEFIGAFRRALTAERGVDALTESLAFTKWVPRPGRMTQPVVRAAIDRSLSRMDVPALDLLQFHWWDYDDANYLEAMSQLQALQDGGLIRHLGLTNFDTEHMARIIDHGVPIVSNQVQYSLIDRRPEVRMAGYSLEHDVHLLTYGTLCGGLIAEKYIGAPEPRRADLDTVSLQKYKQMIDAWGGWSLFQELLVVLDAIARRHEVSIANVAVRYILDRPAVAGVIVGTRLGIANHRDDNARVFNLTLDEADLDAIERVLSRSRDLYALIGDCGDEYRR